MNICFCDAVLAIPACVLESSINSDEFEDDVSNSSIIVIAEAVFEHSNYPI